MPERSINSLFSSYHKEWLKRHPVEATIVGYNRYNDLLPNDLTQSYKEDLRAFYTKYKELLEIYDRDSLGVVDQMSYDVLKWECDINLEGLKYPLELMPINQMSSLHLTIGRFASGNSMQPFNKVIDYDNWLSRLNAFVDWCDTAIINMKTGIETGYVLPEVLVTKVIPQMAAFDHGPVEEHLFYNPIRSFPEDFPTDDRAKLRSAYAKMIEDKIIPVFKRFHDFLRNEYLPASRKTPGFMDLPDGKMMYEYFIRNYTNTEMSADELFELGLREVKRITGEMEKVKRRVGFKRGLKDFFNYVRKNRELMPFTESEQVIANFDNIHNTMKPHLGTLFGFVPQTPFEIKRTEAFREASANAQYDPGSADGSRPGIFSVPVPDATQYNTFYDESLFLHEAIPGHHYQISLQQESKNLHEFRKVLWYSAYGEGWALYTESLGIELGLYMDPFQYFGMLSAEMHRAIRLVVDPGIHAKGWSREKAIKYSLDHEAEPESNIKLEIERYMAVPGQSLSYKIGQLRIRELRTRAENQLGENFDLKEFHSKILETGCIPLNILEAHIDRWINSKK